MFYLWTCSVRSHITFHDICHSTYLHPVRKLTILFFSFFPLWSWWQWFFPQDSSFSVHYKEIHGRQYSWHVPISRILSTLPMSLWVSNVHVQLVGWGLRWSSGTPDYTVSHCCTIILHFCSRHHHLTAPLNWESESPFHLLSQPLIIIKSWKFAVRSVSFPPMHSIPHSSCLW